MVKCDRCGRTAFGRITIQGKVDDDGNDTRGFVLEGVVIPFGPALNVEMMRRGKTAMCVPCWEGKPIPMPIMPKSRVYVGDES